MKLTSVNLATICFAATLSLLLCLTAEAQPAPERKMPANFKSDGCTGFPNGNYRECCVEHDKDYYFGGTRKDRWRSDKRLYNCVRSKKGWKNKLIAPMMWVGVRVGGSSLLPTPFRWGFGKKFSRGEQNGGNENGRKDTPPARSKCPLSN